MAKAIDRIIFRMKLVVRKQGGGGGGGRRNVRNYNKLTEEIIFSSRTNIQNWGRVF